MLQKLRSSQLLSIAQFDDFPGNYSDYRNWKEAKEQKEKEAEKPQEEKTARVRLNESVR